MGKELVYVSNFKNDYYKGQFNDATVELTKLKREGEIKTFDGRIYSNMFELSGDIGNAIKELNLDVGDLIKTLELSGQMGKVDVTLKEGKMPESKLTEVLNKYEVFTLKQLENQYKLKKQYELRRKSEKINIPLSLTVIHDMRDFQ